MNYHFNYHFFQVIELLWPQQALGDKHKKIIIENQENILPS